MLLSARIWVSQQTNIHSSFVFSLDFIRVQSTIRDSLNSLLIKIFFNHRPPPKKKPAVPGLQHQTGKYQLKWGRGMSFSYSWKHFSFVLSSKSIDFSSEKSGLMKTLLINLDDIRNSMCLLNFKGRTGES